MGYYFERAKSRKDLTEEQLGRYEALRSSDDLRPWALESRLKLIRNYIGPLTSGEVMSALEELVQDAFVVWILAGEDPAKAQWANPDDLIVPPSPPTEEERQRAEEWSRNFMRQLEEQRKQDEADWEEYMRVSHPIRHFLGKIVDKLFGRSR